MNDNKISNDIKNSYKSKLINFTKPTVKNTQPIISKLEYHSSNKNKKNKEEKIVPANSKYKMKCLKNCIYIFENYRKRNELFKKNLKLLLNTLFEELYIKNIFIKDPNSLKNIISLNIPKNPQIKFQNEYINSNSNNKYNLIINANGPIMKHKKKCPNNLLKKSKKSNSSSYNNHGYTAKNENKKKNVNLDDILGYDTFRNRTLTIGKLNNNNNNVKINNLIYNNEVQSKTNSLPKNYNNNFHDNKNSNSNKKISNTSKSNFYKKTADNSINNDKQISESKRNNDKKIVYFKGLHKNKTRFPLYKRKLKPDFNTANKSANNEEVSDICFSLKKNNSFLNSNNHIDTIKTNRSDKEIIIGNKNKLYHNINRSGIKNEMSSYENKLIDSITPTKNYYNKNLQRFYIQKNFIKENIYKDNNFAKKIIYEKHGPNKNYKSIKKKVIVKHINISTNQESNMENKSNTLNNIYQKQKPYDTMKTKYSPFKILTHNYIQNNDTFPSNSASTPENQIVLHKKLITKDRMKINNEIGTFNKIVNKTSCNFYPKKNMIETFSKSALNFYTKKIPLKKICYLTKKYKKNTTKKLLNGYRDFSNYMAKNKKNYKKIHQKSKNNGKLATRHVRNDTEIISTSGINRIKKELKLDDMETFEDDDEIKNDDFKIDIIDDEDIDIQSYIINKLKNSERKKNKHNSRSIITKGVEITFNENE